MKKALSVILIVGLFFVYSVPPVQAKTLGDLKSELNDLKDDLQKNKEEKKQTEQKIDETENKVDAIKADIEQTYADIDTLSNEIAQLDKDIEAKDAEIKDIITFVQVSNGESAYMEYLLGAKDFTDFIYRLVVSEQMTDHNDELIGDYHRMIKENEQKKEELKASEVKLKDQQKKLEVELEKLGQKLEDIKDVSISIEDEIKAQKEVISVYENMGCSANEDISTCGQQALSAIVANNAGGSPYVHSSGAFARPLTSGYISSEYGPRDLFGGFHDGIDQSNTTHHIPVYSIGTGIVATVMYQHPCGGNMVIAHYRTGGYNYTAVYAHLYSISVSRGQVLTTSSQIGIMGGGSDTSWYDGCTLGDHLHLSISSGLYLTDYTSWSTLTARSMNPRTMIEYPTGTYNWWYTR